jgi:hypothetical protein
MPKDTVYDPTDRGTLRPNAKPLRKRGDTFKPMELPDFGWEINLPETVSPDDPITLFTIYYTPEIIDIIVQHTNNYVRKPADDSCPRARANNWYPTCCREIYLYFAVRVYITLFVCNEISDYWNTKDFTPDYPISAYISRDRFQELHICVRLTGSEAIGPYARISL